MSSFWNRAGLALCSFVTLAGCFGLDGDESGPPLAATSASASTRSAEGISDFDRIVQPGRGRPLPTTFRDLVTLVEEKAQGSASIVFIPKGRSLVRDATTLKDPRIVAAVFTGEADRVEPTGVSTRKAGIYMGFSKTSGIVEVISFNEIAGRFEFELIENFGVPNATARVRLADRELCTSCHRMGTPIFSVGLWSETLEHNADLLAESKRAMGQGGNAKSVRYEGFDVPDEAVADFVDPGVSFEESVDDASKRLTANALWKDTCKDDAACRANLVAFALYTRGEYWQHGAPSKKESKFYVLAKAAFDASAKKAGLSEIRPLSPVITSRDPLKEKVLTEIDDPLFSEPVSRSVYKASEMDLFSVSTSFDFVGGAFTDDDARRVRVALSANDGPPLMAALEARATTTWRDMAWAKTRGPLVRCDVLEAILPNVDHPGCSLPPDLAKVRAPSASVLASSAKDDELTPFRAKCGGCHSSGAVQPAFLAEPKEGETAVALFRAWAHCVAPVLDWESPGARVMPPKTSPRHAELANDPALRRRMTNLASIEAVGQRALEGKAGTLPKGTCPSSTR